MTNTRHFLHQTSRTHQGIKRIRKQQTTQEKELHMYKYHTGRFPHRSSWVNIYHMIIDGIDRKSTCVEPINDRTEEEMMFGRARELKCIILCVILPKHQVLDNESPKAYKKVIKESWMTYQLVPLDGHQQNILEKSIQIQKYHFIGVLSGTSETYPMNLWYQLIP